MDAATSRLVDFALQSEFADLPAETVHECKRRLIDTVACAVGAYDDPLSYMARAVAKRQAASRGAPAASVLGCRWKTTPEAAAFANGVMMRLLDLSDTYRVRSGGHPNDVIAGIFAVGDAVRADGASVINAVTLAYDVYCGFIESVDVNSQGWDQPVYGVVASALGIGKLLNLSREQMGSAVALALAPNMALYQTRQGELSAWKGCAAANASRNAVFAALLARDGFTGPTAVIEGKCGLWDIVGRFDWDVSVGPGRPHRITRTDMKCYPICYHAQSAVWAALDIRTRLRVQDIGEIEVQTYQFAAGFLGGDPSRWAPTTRETADHSLPYVVAVTLLDGELTSQSFAEARLQDPAVISLMRKVKVQENAELSARYPRASSCRLRIRTQSGATVVAEVEHPKGHINNPMDDAELEAKFRDLFRGYGDEQQCTTALNKLWSFERAGDVTEVLGHLITRS